MQTSLPEYLLIAELLGFGTGTVISVLLFLLVRRSRHRSPGSTLLCYAALLWNVFGLVSYLMVLFGIPLRSWPVALARATYLSGGAIFPISFLQLWRRPVPAGGPERRGNEWLVWIARVSAAVLVPLLFICPFVPNLTIYRFTMHAVPWNASILLTIGAFTHIKGRLRGATDRLYLVLSFVGVWSCTVAIVLLENFTYSPRVSAVLVIAKEQGAFLAVFGALFFFAWFRASDVLIKSSLRLVGAVSIGVWSYYFLRRSLPAIASHVTAFPAAAQAALGVAVIATLMLLFHRLDHAIETGVDCWLLRQPDFRETLRELWEQMVQIHAEDELFRATDSTVQEVLGVRSAAILNRADFPVVESHAAANAGRLWELACDDACRRLLPERDVDVLVPVRVHGEITHILAIAPGPRRRSLVNSELTFLRSVAAQTGRRLEAIAHERETIERQSREAKLRELAAQAELKALRAQINPHFLFNSLNTIADLIVSDPAKAEVMTLLLSKVLRHVLIHTDQQITRVAEEIEFLRTYLGIEQVRFGERLQVSMAVDPEVSQDEIPSLILQPVVENAIKHGLAPKIGRGRLNITAGREGEFVRLAVEDDGVGAAGGDNASPSSSPAGSGLGLRIIADRLRTLYHGRASLTFEPAELSGSRVTILIPRGEVAG